MIMNMKPYTSILKASLWIAATALIISCGSGEAGDANLSVLKQKKDSLRKVKNDVAKELSELELQIKMLDTAANGHIPLISVTELTKGHFDHYFEVQGVVETEKNASVTAEVAGKIMSINVNEGQRVTKGQVLMHLDSKVLENNIEEVKTQLELAETVYEKQKSLWDQKIGSEIQYLEAKNNVESLKKRLESLNAQLDMYYIKAPFDGEVDEIFPKVGEMASPMLPLLRILNMDQAYIKADISERFIGKIKVGDTSIISFPSLEMEFPSKITRLGNFINPNNRTFKIRFDFKNSRPEIKPNLLAKINILDYSNQSAIVVPTKIIQETPSGDEFVYVVEKADAITAKKVMVKTGMSYKGNIEVLEGLNESDLLVTKGARSIKDGDIVEISE